MAPKIKGKGTKQAPWQLATPPGTSAFEAYRMAQGDGALVSSRVLLWFAVGLVLVSVLMATVLIFTAARR